MICPALHIIIQITSRYYERRKYVCGIIRFDGSKVNKVKAQGMLKSLARRGPDNQDSYEKDMIYLGHRRLSIIDILNNAFILNFASSLK